MGPDYSFLNPYADEHALTAHPKPRKKLKVINLFAGPGAGKSTTAAGLFNLLKMRGHNVELVTEFAKDLTWAGRQGELANQLYILGKQDHKLFRVDGKVDMVVSDSPLLLGLLYAAYPFDGPWFRNTAALAWAVLGAWNRYDNHSFFIDRVKPYNPAGRNQTHAEAKVVDAKTLTLLEDLDIKAPRIPGDENAPYRIYDIIMEREAREDALRDIPPR